MAQVSSSTSFSTAARSFSGAYMKPGTSGRNPSWYFGWAVAVMAANVRPWNEFSKVMILYRPWPTWMRASLMAASMASAPELQKNVLPPNPVVAIHSASRRLRLGVPGVGHVDQLGGLLGDRLDQARVAVADARDGPAAEEVDVPLAVGVPDVRPLAAHGDARQALVVADDVLGVQVDDFLRCWHFEHDSFLVCFRSRQRADQGGRLTVILVLLQLYSLTAAVAQVGGLGPAPTVGR